MDIFLFLDTEAEFFVTHIMGVLKDKIFKTFLIFRASMCLIPTCPVLMDCGAIQEFELTGEHKGRANHIISVGQVEKFDKSDSSIYYGGTKPLFHKTVFDGTSTKAPTNKNMARAPS